MRLTFFGVRGSTPAFQAASTRYGGNTASVVLEEPDEEPILLDLGTGLRAYGSMCPMDGSFAGTALVTHIHWDHVQGLPFFAPLHVPGSALDVYGPHQEEGPLGRSSVNSCGRRSSRSGTPTWAATSVRRRHR